MKDAVGRLGLQYFGAMTASISHELKNRMAIINENAGLLEDLTMMAAKGRPLDPQRLEKMAGALKAQVALADEILKKMNRFAHVVDDFVHPVDIGRTVALTLELARRLADIQCVELRLKKGAGAITVITAGYVLMNLIWSCLQSAFKTVGKDGCIEVDCQPDPDGARICMQLNDADDKPVLLVSSDDTLALAAAIGATVVYDTERQQLQCRLPQALDPVAQAS